MPKDKNKKRSEEIRNLWVNSDNATRQRWQTREQKAYDFFLNSQLTEEEEDALEAAGMPTFVINRVTPIVETMKYFATANNPRWKAIGADGADVDLAEIHTNVIDYSWYISGGKALLAQVVGDAFTKGKGYLHIVIDPNADKGMGEVKFEFIDPFCVWVSANSADVLERDANYHIIKKDLSKEVLLDKFPQYSSKIKKARGHQDSNYFTERDITESDSIQPGDVARNSLSALKSEDGCEDEVIQYYEVYEPIKVLYYNLSIKEEASEEELLEAKQIIQKELAFLKEELSVGLLEKKKQLQIAMENGEILKDRYVLEMKKAEDMSRQALAERESLLVGRVRDEAAKIVQKFVTEKDYEKLKNVFRDDILSAIPYYEGKVKKTCVVGDQVLYENILNISHVPLIAVPYLHTGTPFPMSAVTPLIGKQREINRAHQIMVHNANLASNLRWLFAEGEIDEDLWEQYSAAPSALLPYRPGLSPTGPREIMPQNINNAFFTIEQDSKTDMEYMAGIQPTSMGIASRGDETYRGLLAKDEYGTRRLRSWISNVLEPALEHTGKIFQEYAKSVYSINKVFRIVQPGAGQEPETKEIEINIPIYDDFGKAMGRYNDYASSRYDIRIVSGSTLPVNRWAILEEYKQYLELNVIDDIAFIAQTDIKNKEALLQRKSRMSQLIQQVESLENQLSDKEGTIETLSRQLVQAGIKDQVREYSSELDRSKTETKMIDKLIQERLRDSLKQSRQDMQLEIDKLKAEIKGVKSKK